MSADKGRMMREQRQGKVLYICCSKHFRHVNDPFSRQIEERHALRFEERAECDS